MSKTTEFTVNKQLPGFKIGQTVMIELDNRGVPVDRMWRRRMKDSAIDGCISRTQPTPKTKPPENKDS